ncbi:hypothetical protein JoomaDRAFT_1563 [Galbibacter orientalis DSM 19592]|uniref:Uncharacterized protein n=1 Tax=Galbibacter orientalis DSM 19592 TaxID=926559 RepID=I3C4N4_9FLAO|nr:hypothetical protein [Galbibacter orientalis]EIJ38577.1 hypothetical protein JoomaDRAFT_1563 [Galbibacter orientalis DSM 19592]
MEEQGYIEIRVTNRDNSLSPKDIDINEVKDFISDIETFLYPNRKEKHNRPHISYDIEEGSAKHKFFLPITAVILFNGLTTEIKNRKSLDFLDYKRQSIIDKFQKKALSEGYKIEFNNSMSNNPTLIIDESTNYERIAPTYFESEFYLYGEIYQEGGKNPNLHMSTNKYGNITISATKEQIMDGEKKTYKPYGIKVRGKKNLEDESLFDLVLLEFIQYKPVFNKSLLDKVIDKASVNLNKITNVDTWLNDIKAKGI